MIEKFQFVTRNGTINKPNFENVKTITIGGTPSTTKFIQMLTYKYWTQQMPMQHLILTLVPQ